MAEQAEERWTRVAGLRLYSRALGPREAAASSPAPAVVLVHGLGMSSRYMEPLLLRLSARYRVYAPDLPGIGRSQAPPQPLDPAERAEVLHGWVHAVGLQRPALLAHSAGCEVARHFVQRHRECVACTVLASPAPDPTRRYLSEHVARLLLDAFREAPSLWAIAIGDYRDAGPQRMLHTLRTALHTSSRFRRAHRRWAGSTWEGSTTPTLVVRGERDLVVSADWAQTVRAASDDGTLITIAKAAHALNYTNAPALAQVVEPFLDRHLNP